MKKIKLFLNTINALEAIFIYDDNFNFIDKFERILNKNVVDTLNDDLLFLLKNNNLFLKDISEIYFVDNIGSFTGMRVISLFLKTWHLIYPETIYFKISNLELQSESDCISIINIKSGLYLISKYENNKLILNSKIMSLKEKNEFILQNSNLKVIEDLISYKPSIIMKSKFTKIDDITEFQINYVK